MVISNPFEEPTSCPVGRTKHGSQDRFGFTAIQPDLILELLVEYLSKVGRKRLPFLRVVIAL
jgi:hypothetical protein